MTERNGENISSATNNLEAGVLRQQSAKVRKLTPQSSCIRMANLALVGKRSWVVIL
jgi:hypothetical protein